MTFLIWERTGTGLPAPRAIIEADVLRWTSTSATSRATSAGTRSPSRASGGLDRAGRRGRRRVSPRAPRARRRPRAPSSTPADGARDAPYERGAVPVHTTSTMASSSRMRFELRGDITLPSAQSWARLTRSCAVASAVDRRIFFCFSNHSSRFTRPSCSFAGAVCALPSCRVLLASTLSSALRHSGLTLSLRRRYRS